MVKLTTVEIFSPSFLFHIFVRLNVKIKIKFPKKPLEISKSYKNLNYYY